MVFCLAAGLGPATAGATQRVHVHLIDALPQVHPDGTANRDKAKDLYLQTSLDESGFGWIVGYSPDYNRALHRGRHLAGSLDEKTLSFEVEIQKDPWVPGGRGRYTLRVTPEGDGRWAGQYEGVFERVTRRGEPMVALPASGEAVITFTEPLNPPANWSPPARDAHPRLLLRQAEVEALRQRARTPVGKALAHRVLNGNGVVSLGLSYQLTGEADYARRAIPGVRALMADNSPGAFNGADGAYAHRIGEVAQAYDLCYTAWPQDFREQVTSYLAGRAATVLFNPTAVTAKTNWSPNSNYMGHFSGAGGLAGLLIHDKPGPRPQPPTPPEHQPLTIATPDNLPNGEGVPINAFAAGQVPARWLRSPAIDDPEHSGRDYLEALGGHAKSTPSVGSSFQVGEATLAFAEAGGDDFWENGGHRSLELMGATGKQFHSTIYFYTVIEVEEPQLVQFRDHGAASATRYWMDGREILSGDFLKLQPGRHPLMARAHLFKINPWGKSWLTPVFETVDQDDVERGLQATHLLHELAMRKHEEDLAYWENNDGASPWHYWLMLCGTKRATDYHRYTFGDGGFQVEGEGYTSVGADLPLLFEVGYVNTFGHRSTGRPDVSHFGPRYVAQTIYLPGGETRQQSFSLTDGTQPVKRWPISFPTIPDDLKPACLWAWNMQMGIPDGGAGRSALERGDDEAFIKQLVSHCGDPAMSLLYYPFELRPQHPGEQFPKVWQAKHKGLYVFRNGWEGGQDIVAQLFLKSEGEGGCQNQDGGALRLYGLGRAWTGRGKHVGKTTLREAETVVALPDQSHNRGGRALMTHFDPRPDGSGTVTADMNLIYASTKTHTDSKGKTQTSKLVDNGFRVHRENLEPTGITGLRALGVDYSGQAGTPGVFVLVDQIDGGKEKRWSWQLPSDINPDQVTFDAQGFTIRDGEATCRVTFISPAKINARYANQAYSMLPKKDNAKDNESFTLHAVHVTGEDPTEGRFVAVITLGHGDPPDVTAEANTRQATLTIGKQSARFDGEKVIFANDGK